MPPATVTIVTRTQRPGLLGRALDSVLAQTRGDWRLVVVNDAGPVAEVDAVVEARRAAARGRIEVRHRAASLGMEAASNAGFGGADTPFLTLLDDDDTWAPTFLERMLGAASALPVDVAGVVCRSVVVHEAMEGGAPVERRREAFNPELLVVGLEGLTEENRFTNNAFVFRREVYERLGGFWEALRVYGDWDFSLRVLCAHEVEVLPEALAFYHRRDGGSFGGATGTAERYRARLVNGWLRGEGGRAPMVGVLLVQGRAAQAQRAVGARVDKVMNALHRVRRLPGLRQLDRLLAGGADEA